MKRAFIWGPLNFPHGSSSANYVQHFADALIDLGYHVVILSDANKGGFDAAWIFAIFVSG